MPEATLICEYQICTDDDPREVMSHFLREAWTANKIQDWHIDSVHGGVWGIGLVRFTVDILVRPSETREMVYDRALPMLNAAIHDSDVEIRWVAPKPIQNPAPGQVQE